MPADTRTWLLHVTPLAALAGFGLWNMRRVAGDTRALALLTVGWLVASASSVKWLEYAVPFGVATLALSWRDNVGSRLVLWCFAPLAVWNGFQVITHVRATVPAPERLAEIAAALPSRDCRVFHADWSDFPELVFWAPQCSYVVGLDPHFLSAGDPRRAELVEGALAGRVTRLGDMAERAFGADWVVATNAPMIARAESDARLEPVVRNASGGLWRVRPAAQEPPDAGRSR
jgi:hypothetical protein